MQTPTQIYRRIQFKPPVPIHKGLDGLVNRWIGSYRRRDAVIKGWWNMVEQVEGLAAECKNLGERALRERLSGFRDTFRRGGRNLDGALISALAAIRETSERQLGMRPFQVQILSTIALHKGYLAEMATGEGKTLTAGLAAVLAGWTRLPCHIVTVNDYLVHRDATWLQALYEFCGVRVGYVTGPMKPEERRHGYQCDITYTTSKELLADFLRDGISVGEVREPSRRLVKQMLRPQLAAQEGLVMRGLHTVIVDEADSVLIDEAVTPLIISAQKQNESLKEVVEIAHSICDPLVPKVDYDVNLRYREVELTDAGRQKIEHRCSALPGIWRGMARRDELIKQALNAREFFLKGKQYVIVDRKVVIVDEFTGRPMPQRTWRQGMHQAIEAKELLPISPPSETIARMSFQRFFRLFHKVCGMTGTASEATEEFWQIYGLPVVRIPTNKPCVREQMPDKVFGDEDSKWAAVADEIERVHRAGRPVLVGTRSVAASEKLAALLEGRTLHFQLLNALRHAEEASIISMAGETAHITIATNMAGRGTDIKLGKEIAHLGGLHVIATERHESGRVDRQLFGRSARQGDPGSSQAFVSAEDELLKRFLPAALQRRLAAAVRHNLPGKRLLARAAFRIAQANAQRIAFKQRQSVLRADTWLEEALSFAGGGNN